MTLKTTQAVEQVAHLMRRAAFGATRDRTRPIGAQRLRRRRRRTAQSHIGRIYARRPHPPLPSRAVRHDGAAKPRRLLALQDDLHQRAAAREDEPVLAHRLRHRLPQNHAGQSPQRPNPDVPPLRNGQLPRTAAGTLARSRDDCLAGQPRQPQGRHQRKLGARTAGTLQHGRGQLLRRRHQRGVPRPLPAGRLGNTEYMALRAERDSILAIRQNFLALPIQSRRPRRGRKDIPRPNRQPKRRRHRGHHLPPARHRALHLPPPLRLLRRRRAARPAVAIHSPARSRRHTSARRRLLRQRLRNLSDAANPIHIRLLSSPTNPYALSASKAPPNSWQAPCDSPANSTAPAAKS